MSKKTQMKQHRKAEIKLLNNDKETFIPISDDDESDSDEEEINKLVQKSLRGIAQSKAPVGPKVEICNKCKLFIHA